MKKNFLVNTVSLYLSKPYKTLISYSNSSFKFLEQGYMLSKPLKSFFSIYWKITGNARKCSVLVQFPSHSHTLGSEYLWNYDEIYIYSDD